MPWPRDADVTFQKQEPVLIEIERSAPPAPEPERDDLLALDPRQRGIVEEQWALVERAFRRDLPNHKSAREAVQPTALPSLPPRAADPAFHPVAASAPVDPLARAMLAPGPIQPSVDVPARMPRDQPKVRSSWFGGPSVAEQKRIVNPGRLAASASGAAQRQRAMLLSVVAIACASAALAVWRLDRPVDRRLTAAPPASGTPLAVSPSAAPAKALAPPPTAQAQQRKAEAARPTVSPSPPAAPAAAGAGAGAGTGPTRSANEVPVADRARERARRESAPVAAARPPAPQRAQAAPARSTRSAWQRDERFRDANARAPIAPVREPAAPWPDAASTAAGPMPAPLPYHPTPAPAWRNRAGPAAETPRGMATPLPYGVPETGATPGNR